KWTQRLSFSEVMKLVLDSQEVPGVKKPDVQPSNQSPTPPQRPRILKPWETAPKIQTAPSVSPSLLTTTPKITHTHVSNPQKKEQK
uniref:Peroxisomal membrane protein PEX14-like KPWE domain-containing protein n=1 Tax=Gouania willdenowi TaxID=441366 RepID=A0A8C5E110_GOUWI